MKLKMFCLSMLVAGAALAGLIAQPGASHAFGITTDVERQACHPFRVRAMRANRQAKAGEISDQERRAYWLEYRDCLGAADKNYLLPPEFKY